jgi:F-type H+-transporting ATPase subunit g
VKQLWRNRSDLKVEHAGVAALFGIELYAWFCAGEIVGRGFTLSAKQRNQYPFVLLMKAP